MKILNVICCSLVLTVCCACGGPAGSEAEDGQASAQDTVAFANKDTEVPMAEMDFAMSDALMSISPGEALRALDKLGAVNWDQVVAGSQKSRYAADYAAAMNLGVRVSDAMVAVNRESQTEVMKYWSSIKGLAGQLGYDDRLDVVEDSLRGNFVLGRWSRVRRTLDDMYHNVESLAQVDGASAKDQQLGILVGIGSWLEGMSILSNHLAPNYNRDDADLLNQGPLLSDYLDELKRANISDPLTSEVQAGLEQLQGILGTADLSQVSQRQVSDIQSIVGGLIDKIVNAA